MIASSILAYIVVAILLALVTATCWILVSSSNRAESVAEGTVDQLRKLGENLQTALAATNQSQEGLPKLLERVESLERRHEQLSNDFTSRAAQLSSRITRLGTPGVPMPEDEEDEEAANLAALGLQAGEEQLELPMDRPRRRRARRRRR